MESLELKSTDIIKSWHDEIEARKSSGMGIKEWCNQRGYPESRCYYHLRMVRRTKKEKEEPDLSYSSLPHRMHEKLRYGRKNREFFAEISDGFRRRDYLKSHFETPQNIIGL